MEGPKCELGLLVRRLVILAWLSELIWHLRRAFTRGNGLDRPLLLLGLGGSLT